MAIRSLVLGGTGFIGSHLVDSLLEAGHQVRAFDRHPEAYRPAQPGVDYRFGSFDHAQDIAQLFDGVDLVFHLISTTLPKTSNDDPAFDVTSNLVPTLRMLDLCVKAGVKRVVYASSGGTVYGEPARLPVAEDDATEPNCSYGVTKLAVEKYLHYYRHQFDLEAVAVRPSNAYGPRQNPAGIQGAIGVFLGRLLKGQPIEIWGDGSVVRDYIYVKDLAEGIVKAGTVDAPSKVFNLGSGEGQSLLEVLARIERLTGKKAQLSFKEARRFDTPKTWLDISRAQRELGWSPRTSLDDGITQTMHFLKGLGG